MFTMDDAGFSDAQQQLADLQTEQHQLASDVASGSFSIEPGSARAAAKACRDQVTEIDSILGDVSQLGTRANFGDCTVGHAMSAKYADKATTGDGSLRGLLEKAKTILTDMAKNYDDAATSYEQTDADASTALSYRAE